MIRGNVNYNNKWVENNTTIMGNVGKYIEFGFHLILIPKPLYLMQKLSTMLLQTVMYKGLMHTLKMNLLLEQLLDLGRKNLLIIFIFLH